MLSIKETFNSEYEIKKSKFISYLTPYENFKKLLEKLKNEHPKARHFVYAYRYLNEYDQIVEKSSDDGEPKGTSGKPTLATLSGKNIINCAIITVRYFGGIKLGTGGLVKAYSDSANKVIQNAKLFPYKKEHTYSYHLEYKDLQKYEYLLNKFNIKILEKIFDKNVTLKILCEEELQKKFENELKKLL